MGYFETDRGVDEYLGMTGGSDRRLVEALSGLVAPHSRVLEIGMGPGHDLLLLAERYDVVGTDRSPIFVRRFAEQHPQVDVRVADAVALDVEDKFDALYSNKVLQHLTADELNASLSAQHRVLVQGGVALHTLWHGSEYEEFQGLRFQQYTEDTFAATLGDRFNLESAFRYSEESDAEDDSLAVVLRRVD